MKTANCSQILKSQTSQAELMTKKKVPMDSNQEFQTLDPVSPLMGDVNTNSEAA